MRYEHFLHIHISMDSDNDKDNVTAEEIRSALLDVANNLDDGTIMEVSEIFDSFDLAEGE